MTPARPLSYAFGAFRLDAAEKVLFQEDRPVPLTPKAAETLLALVERHGRLVTKEELFRIVWPDTFVEENNLAQNISTLRRVLGEGGDGRQLIETVPRRGYRFVGPVDERADTGPDAVAPPVVEPMEATPLVPSAVQEPTHARAWPRRSAVSLLAAAVAVTLLFLAVRSRTRARPADASGAPASAPAPAGERTGTEGVIRIAVLPFVNLGSPDDAYFAAGMTEEITSRLAGLSRLAVSSSTTVTQYDRSGKSMRRIGGDLGVGYVVEGSVRSAHLSDGTQVRITPKLIRVADDTAVWTQQYDASLRDLLGVQADIAYQIAGALPVALEARERRTVEARSTTDTEAYLAYLRGITAYHQGWSDTSNQARARTELEDAVARDPRFALAWSWLSRVYAEQYRSGAQRKPETRLAAQRAARTAIELDPGLPDGHLGLAGVLMNDCEYARALGELEIAQVGLPNSPDLFRLIGGVEQRMGRWETGLTAYMRGFDLDTSFMADAVGVHYLLQRQYPEAARFIAIAKAGNRASVAVPEAWTRFSENGDVAAARRVLEPALAAHSPADGRVRGLLARLEWFDGHHQRALDLIAGMDPAGAWLPMDFRFPASLAAGQVYESLGRRQDAARSYATALLELERRQRSAPDDFQIEAALGMAAAGLGRGPEALRHSERAVALLPLSRDAAAAPLYLYLLAQVQARLGLPDAAFATLDRMFAVPGFYNETWVQRDPGFAALWGQPAFRAHVARWSSQKGDALVARRAEAVRE